MIGQTIEKLKDPKNSVTTLLLGWGLCIAAFYLLDKAKIPLIGKGIGLVGLAIIALTIVRLAVTKKVLLIACAAGVVLYGGAYLSMRKSARKKTILSCAFAPAIMASDMLKGKGGGDDIISDTIGDKMKLKEGGELQEGARSHKGK
jgi:hypothetical protein